MLYTQHCLQHAFRKQNSHYMRIQILKADALYLHIRVLKATTASRPCRKMPKVSVKSPLEQPRALGSVGEELEDAADADAS